ncbi:hypothetical protein Pint_04747 [Pistacia integerrima]|uniref:Uncharacterized protein n=1 Tax=Pistacia integerrima TaxID=434235 RepID=A0ACC0Z590_9ROSI|nr:hypothetical protein Pint_04747 [Pistacia integerrima]
MNSYDEQRLRDEVIYLHSLWHQGPPRIPNPPPNQSNDTRNSSRNPHKPTTTSPLKKQKKMRSSKKLNIVENKSDSESDSDPDRDWGPKWPVNSPPTAGWGEVKLKAESKAGPLSAGEKAKQLAMQVEQKGLQACQEFFSNRDESDEEEDRIYDEEFGEMDYLTEDDEGLESKEFNFLLELFVKDDKLRSYYEKNHDRGQFCCLVCRGIGEKLNKRYKDCLGLVQHTISISKTKRKRAHRALGQVVCKVLGWDFDSLPVIVFKAEPLGTSLVNSGVTQDEAAKANAEDNKEDMTVAQENEGSRSGNDGEIVEKVVLDGNRNDGELMIGELQSSVKVDDAKKAFKNFDGKFLNVADKDVAVNCWVGDVGKCVENLDSKFLNMEADKGVAVDCQESGPSLATSMEWPCLNPVDESSIVASGWPTLKPHTPSLVRLPSAEEQAKIDAVQLQQKVSEACREFFEKSAGSDGDQSDDEDGPEDSEEFKFFLKVFIENSELRSYYEQNYEGGKFCCLVCGGIGKKVWKNFKSCLGLLQHSNAILKTKKKRAHRAFGQAICRVLGWDIDRFPTIVLKGEPLSHSLAKLGMSLVTDLAEVEANADDYKDGLSNPNNKRICEVAQKEDSTVTISENYLIEDDTSKHATNVCNGILAMERSQEGATDVLVPQDKDGIAN